MSSPCLIFTDLKHETESIAIPAIIASIVALLIGAGLTAVVCIVILRKIRKRTRKSITVASGEMTLQSTNIYLSASSNDAPTINRERKVK